MNRRKFLGAAGLGLAGLSGCIVENHYPNSPSETSSANNNTNISNETIEDKPKVVSPEGVVIFQMDDVQAGWLEKEAQKLVDGYHIAKEIPVTLGVIPESLKENWSGITGPLKKWHRDNKDLVEIAVHTYNHQDYAGMSLEEQIADIKKGIQIFNDVGIDDIRTFVPAMSWGNEYTPEAIRNAGLKIGLNGLANWEVDEVDYLKEPVILHDGVFYKNEGDGFDEWDFGLIRDKVDNGIARRGYFVVGYHQQDFDPENVSKEVYESRFEAFGKFLDDIKGTGKYNFMTAGQYVDSINIVMPVITSIEINSKPAVIQEIEGTEFPRHISK